MQAFCPRIDMLKGNHCILRIQGAPLCQKVLISYFQSQFSMPKIDRTFFFNFNFWTTLFSKIMPNFWRIGAPRILKIQWFPLIILIFGQRSCFLGPTIFKIPQPNWYMPTYIRSILFIIFFTKLPMWFIEINFRFWVRQRSPFSLPSFDIIMEIWFELLIGCFGAT